MRNKVALLKKYNRIKRNIIYKPTKTIYVCSYGGCGSKTIQNALTGENTAVFHLHSFKPPKELAYIYGGRFNKIKQPKSINESEKIIIYIYKNPIHAIYSRFVLPQHLVNMGVNPSTTIEKVVEKKEDIFRLNEYFNDFTTDNDRDYPIYCIKYEDIFDEENQRKLSEIIGVNVKSIIRKETKRNYPHYEVLKEIYQPLIDKMDALPFIHISH